MPAPSMILSSVSHASFLHGVSMLSTRAVDTLALRNKSDLSYLLTPHQSNLPNLEKGKGEKGSPALASAGQVQRVTQSKALPSVLTAMALVPRLSSELGAPLSSLTPMCSTQGAFMQHLLSLASPPPLGSPEAKPSLSEGCCMGGL